MADLVKKEVLLNLAEGVMGETKRIVNQLLCDLGNDAFKMPIYLLYVIAAKLSELTQASTFGNHYFRIQSYSLNTVPVKILERDSQKFVRKVSLWVDSQTGGPTVTIRVSTGGSGTGGGGIRVLAGQVNELQEVPPDTELWAASTTAINCYVVERA